MAPFVADIASPEQLEPLGECAGDVVVACADVDVLPFHGEELAARLEVSFRLAALGEAQTPVFRELSASGVPETSRAYASGEHVSGTPFRAASLSSRNTGNPDTPGVWLWDLMPRHRTFSAYLAAELTNCWMALPASSAGVQEMIRQPASSLARNSITFSEVDLPPAVVCSVTPSS